MTCPQEESTWCVRTSGTADPPSPARARESMSCLSPVLSRSRFRPEDRRGSGTHAGRRGELASLTKGEPGYWAWLSPPLSLCYISLITLIPASNSRSHKGSEGAGEPHDERPSAFPFEQAGPMTPRESQQRVAAGAGGEPGQLCSPALPAEGPSAYHDRRGFSLATTPVCCGRPVGLSPYGRGAALRDRQIGPSP